MLEVIDISIAGNGNQRPYLHLQILMDDTKKDSKGNPEPNFIRELSYGFPPKNTSMDDWISQILSDVIPTIEAELPFRNNPPADPLAKWKGHKFGK